MPANRFDFEQQILKCWGLIDCVEEVAEHIETTEDYDQDKILIMLRGTKELYEIRFTKLFDMFEELIKQKEL